METYLKILKVPQMGKKGQLGALLFANPIVLIILGVVLLLILLAFVGVAWFLALNVFTFIGVFIIVIAGLMAMKGWVGATTWGLFALGSLFVFVPMASDSLSAYTLAVVLP